MFCGVLWTLELSAFLLKGTYFMYTFYTYLFSSLSDALRVIYGNYLRAGDGVVATGAGGVLRKI